MRLENRVAVICGAGGRIGRAVAILFAQEGARVALVTRGGEAIQETLAVIQGRGGQAIAVEADPTSPDGARLVVDQTVQAFGSLQVLYYGAGSYVSGERKTAETTDDDWESMIRVNLRGGFEMARAALPEMVRAGGGSIILVGAAPGAHQQANVGYAAAKGAVPALVQKIAQEYRDSNVRANAILPRLVARRFRGEVVGPVAEPVTGPGRPEDIAYAALYLASQEARLVTGVVLPVDGGADL